jgi:hypothetical protein
MYQNQTEGLKASIIKDGGFDGSVVENGKFSGIQIVGVRKVPRAMNGNNHHVYVDLEEYRGSKYKVYLNQALYFLFEKPLNENGCNAPLWSTNNSIQIVGNDGKFSQVISNLSYAWDVWGHSSWYVYAKFTSDVIVNPPSETETQKLIREIEERFKRLKEILA